VGAKEIQAIAKLVILKILSYIKGPQEMIKKNMLLERLEEATGRHKLIRYSQTQQA
jgi:hypothetical protein